MQAQKNLEILGTPDDSYGYLIWATNDSTYKYAALEILSVDLSVDPNASSGLNNPKIEKRIEVYGNSFYKVPFQIWRDAPSNIQYSIVVNAYGVGVVSTDTIDMLPVGGGGELICKWACNGPNYAYQINEVYLDYQGTYTYSVQNTYADTNGYGVRVPYYRYFDQDEFAYYTGLTLTSGGQNPGQAQGNSAFHEIPEWTYSYWGTPNEPFMDPNHTRILQFENTSTYRDINGSVISGDWVYGIQKARGDWRTQMNTGTYSTTVDSSTYDRCNNAAYDFAAMRNFINTQANPITDIVCEPNLGGEASGSSSGGIDCAWSGMEGTVLGYVDFEHTQTETEDIFSFYYENIFDFIGFNADCVDADGNPVDSPREDHDYSFLSGIQLLSISSFKNGAKNILTTSASQLFNSEGIPQVPAVNFEPGLHRIAVKFPGEPLDYIFVELKGSGTLNIAHKDFFNANIYPNPSQGQSEYSIDMTTSARLKMTYEIYDHFGNLVTSTSYDLEQGHDRTHVFPSDKLDPNGVTLHRFSFSDGSYETLTTLK